MQNKDIKYESSVVKLKMNRPAFSSPKASKGYTISESVLQKDPRIMNREERIKYELYMTDK